MGRHNHSSRHDHRRGRNNHSGKLRDNSNIDRLRALSDPQGLGWSGA